MLAVVVQRVEALFCVREGPSSSLVEDNFFFFFFLFLVSFTLFLLSDVRGVFFGPLFFRATRTSLPTSPTSTSKMAAGLDHVRDSLEQRTRPKLRTNPLGSPKTRFPPRAQATGLALATAQASGQTCSEGDPRGFPMMTRPKPDHFRSRGAYSGPLPVWVTWEQCCSLIGYWQE